MIVLIRDHHSMTYRQDKNFNSSLLVGQSCFPRWIKLVYRREIQDWHLGFSVGIAGENALQIIESIKYESLNLNKCLLA